MFIYGHLLRQLFWKLFTIEFSAKVKNNMIFEKLRCQLLLFFAKLLPKRMQNHLTETNVTARRKFRV